MEDDNLFKNHLVFQGKLQYAKGKRPNVLYFCAIVEKPEPKVHVMRNGRHIHLIKFVSLQPGHLMVIQKAFESFEDLPKDLFVKVWNYVIASKLKSIASLDLMLDITKVSLRVHPLNISMSTLFHVIKRNWVS